MINDAHFVTKLTLLYMVCDSQLQDRLLQWAGPRRIKHIRVPLTNVQSILF